uniref:Uncharacterized protein n=1 Tax=Oryza brachyantha TaxID=4533 RepID=J3N1S9_ORYBR
MGAPQWWPQVRPLDFSGARVSCSVDESLDHINILHSHDIESTGLDQILNLEDQGVQHGVVSCLIPRIL